MRHSSRDCAGWDNRFSVSAPGAWRCSSSSAGVLHVRAQARLARAEAAVQRAETLATMGRMAASIAHEIRNPLGIIRATATRLKKLYDTPDSPDEKFGYIADEVDRLSNGLVGYLGFARDEPPRLVALDLAALVQGTLRLMQPEPDAARVTLATDLPPTCTVRGDTQWLRQMLMNLVLNAVQAMDGGGRLHVQVPRMNLDLFFSVEPEDHADDRNDTTTLLLSAALTFALY